MQNLGQLGPKNCVCFLHVFSLFSPSSFSFYFFLSFFFFFFSFFLFSFSFFFFFFFFLFFFFTHRLFGRRVMEDSLIATIFFFSYT